MNKNRPINLDLRTIKFPPMAIVSILHRISGLALFLLLPFMLYMLDLSLISAESFAQLQLALTHPFYQIVVWLFGTALLYHLLAGLRHLIMDLGYGEQLQTSRNTAWLTIIFTGFLAIVLGIWIW